MRPAVACRETEDPSGDRRTTPSDEGPHALRAERRAAPKPARIPSGDRRTYPSDEGPT